MPLPVVPIPLSTRQSLIARIANPGDQAGWSEFTAVYGPLVYAELRRRGFDHDDAEDITQRVFVGVVRGMRTFHYSPERGRFRDWLGTIVRNETVRAWGDRQRRPAINLPQKMLDESQEQGSDPEWVDAFQAHVLATALERCRPQFEPATWSAFERVWLQDVPAQEVTAAENRTVDWVYVAKSRVLKALAQSVHELTNDLTTLQRPCGVKPMQVEIHEETLHIFRESLRAAGDRTRMRAELQAKLNALLHEVEPAHAEMPMPASIGPYHIVAERGRGGMGVVYEAVDPQLNRRVVVKVLAAGAFAGTKAKERFLREARAAASVRHDALVPVYAVEAPADVPP